MAKFLFLLPCVNKMHNEELKTMSYVYRVSWFEYNGFPRNCNESRLLQTEKEGCEN